MAWRVISIENPARLNLRDSKLVISQNDEEVALPLEDIDTLILDSYGITISQSLLAEMPSFKINFIVCDEKHLPVASLLGYSQSSRGSKNARAQLDMKMPLKKQLWQKNISQKIYNQAMVLRKFGMEYEDLVKLSRNVRSGDVGNNESVAARLYFDRLLQDSTRRRPIWCNSALNYGYAIVRGCIARSAASRGLIASIGINHHSELNQYNLVDDLIESFRPLVDDHVLSFAAEQGIDAMGDSGLSREERHKIIDILNKNGIIKNKKFTVKHLADKVVESFVKATLDGDADELELPEVIND